MAIRRITLSVPEEVAARIKEAAGSTPVSTWVTDLVEDHLDDDALEREWQAFYRDVHPDRKAVRAAATKLRRLTRAGRGRGAA
jgi:hypothetical protein